jgi:hypothetical protein
MEPVVKIETSTGQIDFRTGELPAPHNRKPLEIVGNIYAASTFYEARKQIVEDVNLSSHVKFSRTNNDENPLTIQLIVGEQEQDRITVTGRLTLNEEYKKFGINQPKKYSLDQLLKLIKHSRPFFDDMNVHAALLRGLQNFSANTAVEFTSANDFKGNVASSKIQKCMTNLEYKFNLSLPIYTGAPKSTFEVEIEFEPDNGSIVAWLISTEAKLYEIEQLETIYEIEKAKFNDPLLALIEQ